MPRARNQAATPRGASTASWRWRSPTLERAAVWIAVAMGAALGGRAAAVRWREHFVQAADGSASFEQAQVWGLEALSLVAALAIGAGVAALFVAVLTRQSTRRQAAARPVRLLAHRAARMGLALLAGIATLVALRGLPAGASRGVAATQRGLTELYTGWWVDGAWTIATVLVMIAVFEILAASRALAAARARMQAAQR